MVSDTNLDALQRVADALGVSVRTFFNPNSQDTGLAANPAQESGELTRLFAQINDPKVRRECIEFVRGKLACPRAGDTNPSST